MNNLAKLTIAFLWAVNLVEGAYILAKHFPVFGVPALMLYVVGLAGITVFAESLWKRVSSGEISPVAGGDLAVRSLLSSCFVLAAIGWILRR